jgi:hypothetical protein
MQARLHSPRLDQSHDVVVLLSTGDIGGLDNFLRFWVDLNRHNIIAALFDLHFPYDPILSLFQGGFEHIASFDCGGLGNRLVPGHGLLDIAAELGKQNDTVF